MRWSWKTLFQLKSSHVQHNKTFFRKASKTLSEFYKLIWLGINALLFALTYMRFDRHKEYVYSKKVIKSGLPIARATAMMLNFNCMLILLPVCRNLISLVRSGCRWMPQNILRLFDKNITFHKCCAYMICILSAIHTVAHIVNVEYLIDNWKSSDLIEQRLFKLSDTENTTYMNPFRERDVCLAYAAKVYLSPHFPRLEAIKSINVPRISVAGWTGVVITVALIVMVTSSTELIRRSYFEVFWYTHHLFVIFFIGLVIHGAGGLLRAQYNYDEHDPDYCINIEDWSTDVKCSKFSPQFRAKGPQTWKWVLGPMILYVIERLIRFYRSLKKVELTKVVKHPSKVIELQMKKPGFTAEAGQYVFLQCPKISRLEWHPFTLTSCPEEDFFSVHIRIVGDWTEALSKECDKDELPAVAVDGPFGTASTDVFKYKVCVCIGAGIGVTPFASILKSIWYQHQNQDPKMKVQKVYFYWICPDTNAFEWFCDLLESLEAQMEEKGLQGFVEYNLYLTRGWSRNTATNIMLHASQDKDIITGLQKKMNFGRPNWDNIFTGIKKGHPSTKIGVFFCGPKGLSHTLHRMSNLHSDDKAGVKFYYNKENF